MSGNGKGEAGEERYKSVCEERGFWNSRGKGKGEVGMNGNY